MKGPLKRVAASCPRPRMPIGANIFRAYAVICAPSTKGQQTKCLTMMEEYTSEFPRDCQRDAIKSHGAEEYDHSGSINVWTPKGFAHFESKASHFGRSQGNSDIAYPASCALFTGKRSKQDQLQSVVAASSRYLPSCNLGVACRIARIIQIRHNVCNSLQSNPQIS